MFRKHDLSRCKKLNITGDNAVPIVIGRTGSKRVESTSRKCGKRNPE